MNRAETRHLVLSLPGENLTDPPLRRRQHIRRQRNSHSSLQLPSTMVALTSSFTGARVNATSYTARYVNSAISLGRDRGEGSRRSGFALLVVGLGATTGCRVSRNVFSFLFRVDCGTVVSLLRLGTTTGLGMMVMIHTTYHNITDKY